MLGQAGTRGGRSPAVDFAGKPLYPAKLKGLAGAVCDRLAPDRSLPGRTLIE